MDKHVKRQVEYKLVALQNVILVRLSGLAISQAYNLKSARGEKYFNWRLYDAYSALHTPKALDKEAHDVKDSYRFDVPDVDSLKQITKLYPDVQLGGLLKGYEGGASAHHQQQLSASYRQDRPAFWAPTADKGRGHTAQSRQQR